MASIRVAMVACVLALGASLGASAQSVTPQRGPRALKTASISGDAYLVMGSGDVRRLAGNDVKLLLADSVRAAMSRCANAQRADDSISAVIDSADAAQNKVVLNPSSAHADYVALSDRKFKAETARDALEQGVARAIRAEALAGEVQNAQTDVNGHFEFASVHPGEYALWAETTIGDNLYTWLKVLIVTSGPVRQDLDNSSVNGVYCGYLVQPWWLR